VEQTGGLDFYAKAIFKTGYGIQSKKGSDQLSSSPDFSLSSYLRLQPQNSRKKLFPDALSVLENV